MNATRLLIVLSVLTLCSCTSTDAPPSVSTATYYGISYSEQENLRKMAQHGNSEAALRLANYYLWSVTDNVAGVAWLNRAAALNNITAQFSLAKCYENLPDVKDTKLSLYWMNKAAQNGSREAQEALRDKSRSGKKIGKE